MNKLTCAIIDDEPWAVKLMETYVERTPFLELRATFSSAVAAVNELKENPVDLLFLDIQMPDLDGLEFSRMLDPATRIVFTTAFSQYAIDGYKVNALDYLLKPISYNDFLAAANKALEWYSRSVAEATEKPDAKADYFFVKSDYRLVRIQFDDILYVEGLKDYVKICLASARKPILALTAMRTVEQYLPSSRFMRVHRSFIVNMDKVDALDHGQIVFGEKHIPVSDSYKETVQAYVNERLLHGRS